ncbi:MAG: CDP-alcohol phosphatidyltransferase family protein [Candidatus Marinimicrobia bacterium]|nr:CDP-alcohol phosphatidyltransferase family protein [Candidatus Neomarinimicrobiota bacterium]
MQSINELRSICQTKPIGRSHDKKTKVDLFFSIYFTWLFLRLGISPNAVTVLSGIMSIIGGILLSSKSFLILILGVLFLHLYYLLDYSDGEVARYNNKVSITGHFLDWYMLFVRDAAMFIGLAIGAFTIEPSKFIIIFGFFAVLTPIMDKTILNSGWTVISWARFRALKTGKEVIDDPEIFQQIEDHMDSSEKNIKKPIGKSPKLFVNRLLKVTKHLSTAIFQHHWSPLVLLILALMQIILNYTTMISYDFRPLLIIYAGIIGPIYIVVKIIILVKKNAFEDGYKRLFYKKNGITSSDYFF